MKLGTIAIVAGLTMIMVSIAWAEVPNVINNQGRLTTLAGVPLFNDPTNAADGQIDLVFSIYDAPTNGAAIWGQTNANVAVHNGLFSVLLGNFGTNVFPATGQVARWLEVTVITNGVASTLSPRKEIVSVAYALRAGDAATWGGLPAAELVGLQTNVAGMQTDLGNIWSNVVYIQGSVAGIETNVAGIQTNLAILQSNLQVNVSNLLGAVGYVVGQTGREPYSSMQAAINAAVSNGFGQLRPVTIEVKPGRYTENLSLKAGIHLKAEIEDGLFSSVVVGNHQYNYNGADPGDLIISGVAFYSPGVTDTNPLFRISGGSYASLRLNHCVLQSTDNGPALRQENTGVRDGRLSNVEMYHCRVRSLLPTFAGSAVELRNGSLLMDEADIYLTNPRARSFLASGASQLLLDNATIRGWIETKDNVYLQLTQSSIDSGDQACLVHNSVTAAVMLEDMLVTTLPGVVVLGSGPVLFSHVGFFYSVYGIRQRLHTNPHALPITGVDAANVGYNATFPAHDNWEDLLGGPGPINVRAALDALVNWAVTVPPPFEEVDPIFTAEGFYRDGSVLATGDFDMDGNEIEDINRIQVNSGAAAGRVLTSDANGFGTWAALPQPPPFVETDPQVDDYMGQFTVPRWRGTNLTGGSITNLDNGNVGIGTPLPIRTLDVNGAAIIRGSLDMNGDEVTNANRIQVLNNRADGRVLSSDAEGFGTWQDIALLERDPQVRDDIADNFVPRWERTNLVGGIIFDNTTNIGIGTDLPGAKLDVNGDASIRGWLDMNGNDITNANRIQLTNGAEAGRVLVSDSRGTGTWQVLSLLERDPQVDDNLPTNAVPRWNGTNLTGGSIYNLANGNVGVGTTNPQGRLDVRSPSDFYLLALAVGTASNTFLRAGDPNRGIVYIGDSQTTNTIIQRFGGNVGIGTDNPGARLTVAGNLNMMGNNISNVNQIQVLDGRADGRILTSDASGFGRWRNITDIFVEHDPQVDDNMAQNAVSRWRGTNLTGGSIVNFDNGNVGIGLRTNDSPRGRLDVRSATDWYLLALDEDGSHHSYLRAGSAAASGVVIIGDQQTERTVIQPQSGKVGIGTYHPDGKLDVRSANNWYLLALDQDGSHHSYLRAGNPDNGVVIIGDQQTERTVIQPSVGKVGIGTYHPAYGLHINTDRTLRLDGSAAANDSYGFSMGGYGFFGIDAPMIPNGRFVVKNNGNVGIGTPAPDRLLEVSSPGTAYLRLSGENASGNAGVLEFYDKSSAHNWQIGMGDTSLDNDLKFYKGTWGSADYEFMRITDGGNVGIGTTTPGARLDINGAAGAANYATLAIKQSYYGQKGIWLQAYQNNNSISLHHDGSVAYLQSDYTGSGWHTPLALQMTGGNVGIGLPNPAYKLDVNGHALIRGALGLDWSDNRIQAFPSTPDPGYNHKPFLALSARAPAYDNRLITTLVPHYEGLYVAEWRNRWPNIHVKEDGRLYVRWYVEEGSDSRTKFDQKPLEYGLAQVMALKPKRYNQAEWEHDKGTGKIIIHPKKTRNDIGLAAQEVQKIIPEAVDVPDDETKQPWAIAYSKLIPVLVNAIQDQQKKIEELENKIERLDKKIRDK